MLVCVPKEVLPSSKRKNTWPFPSLCSLLKSQTSAKSLINSPFFPPFRCEDCRLAFGLASTRFTLDLDKCSSLKLDVAPIPQSVLDAQSSRNASLAQNPITGGEAPTFTATIRLTPAGPIPTGAAETGASDAKETGSSGAADVPRSLWPAHLVTCLFVGVWFW
jgi:hypothetical protein